MATLNHAAAENEFQLTIANVPASSLLLGLALVSYSLFRFLAPGTGNVLVDAPVVGPRNSSIARYFFLTQARSYVEEGYSNFKSTVFKLSGQDILVIPNKYVDELRNLPEHQLSSIQANIDNFEGLYSTTSILLEGHLHTHTIQTKLTPKLASLLPATEEELLLALKTEFGAKNDEYVAVEAFPLILRLVFRIAARHFVGYPLCRDEEWISTAMQYTENAFWTIIILRIFPGWMKPIVACFVPYSWKVSDALRKAKRVIVPLILERRKAQALKDPAYENPTDFLQMMMDSASDFDGQPEKLRHRLLVLTLAAGHTTSMACCQTLFDVCVRPEYVQPLREELKAIVSEDHGFKKQTLTKMRKLDSFMRESQRLNPPSLLGFKRAVKEPITLSDGLVLPQDVHLMMPVYPIVMDPEVTPNPNDFDGFRHFDYRQLPGESNRHQFSTTSRNNLHFGHGKYSCPGRFFAANTIKMIMAHFLLDYEFRLPEGVGRPENISLHEYVFPNPEAKVFFRPRQDECRAAS